MGSLALLLSSAVHAAPLRVVINAAKPAHTVSPVLYGLMTEEINHSYDGGLYAELIQNRSFKDNPNLPVHWSAVKNGPADGLIELDRSAPLNAAQDVSLKLTVTKASAADRVGVANDGYWGIPVKPSTSYRVEFYAKASAGFSGPVSVGIEGDGGGPPVAEAQVKKIGETWAKYSATLTTPATVQPSTKNKFVVSMHAPGTVWLSLVSLFPPTFHNRHNGLRVDIMEKMAAMKPSFLRFPGGNFVEGSNWNSRYQWKQTIGPIEDRPGHQGCWSYRSSDGLGILEFFEWCEDLKMEPVLAVFAGYTLDRKHLSQADMKPVVEDTLDELEYATGDVSTKWGARRAADGHPAPFKVRFVEIGNEDFTDRSGSYEYRFASIFDAVKTKYPSIKCIATRDVQSRKPDLVDAHYYRPTYKMMADLDHYANRDPNAPKVIVGEWATMNRVRGDRHTATLAEAISDAAWMAALERDSDNVLIHCYAPLFSNVNPGGTQWSPNLIGYDALSSYGGPSYYAQAMLSNNRGDVVLATSVENALGAEASIPSGAVGIGAWNTQIEAKDIEVTTGSGAKYRFDPSSSDLRENSGTWTVNNGILAETAIGPNMTAFIGDNAWTDYTYSLKARKTGGAEGFLVIFHAKSPDDLVWWNVGGWGNTASGIERPPGNDIQLGDKTPIKIENDRWYDLKVEVKGRDIKCYIDGMLVTSAQDPGLKPPKTFFATATRDSSTGDIIVKAMNNSSAPQLLDIAVDGVSKVAASGTLIELSGKPDDRNLIDELEKVVPKTSKITVGSPKFQQTLAPYSVNVIRFGAK